MKTRNLKFMGVAILVVAVVAFPSQAQAGGTVNFGNNSSNIVVNGHTAAAITAAANVKVALYWSPLASNNFVQLGSPVTVGVPAAGIFVGGTRTTGDATPGGTSAKFQVRAWAGGYTTYEEALLQPGVLIGQSAVIVNPTGNSGGTPPAPPESLLAGGFAGFVISSNVIVTQPPSISGLGNKTVSCDASWSFDLPTATDGCTGTNLTAAVLATVTNGLCPMTVTRTWSVTNSCDATFATHSQTVTVVDITPPVLTCAANKQLPCGAAWAFDEPAAYDTCDGTSPTLTIVATVTNNLCPPVVTRTWAATDGCGNSNICSQTVTVLCTNCPLLQLTKSCPAYPVPPGGTLAWIGTITNTSSVTVSNIVVMNDQPATNTAVFGPVTLAPGQGASFGGSYNVTTCCGPYVDTLTATGSGLDGILFTGSATASCAGTNHLTPGDLNGDGIVDQGELNAVLANYWAHSPWVTMTNATLLGDGKFQFELTNARAWNFTVLVSTNATDWTNLPGPAFPVYQFTDPEGTNAPQRLYRLQWP